MSFPCAGPVNRRMKNSCMGAALEEGGMCWTCGRTHAICSSKIDYVIWEQARADADEVTARDGIPMWVYRCDICNNYHLTKARSKYRLQWLERRRRKALVRAWKAEQVS